MNSATAALQGIYNMSQQLLCNPDQLCKCFPGSEEAVTIARKKRKKVIETLIKGHFFS